MQAHTVNVYPRTVVTRNSTRVKLRPLAREDREALVAFFARLSDEDRWYLRDDVLDPTVIEGWLNGLNYERVLPIVAEVDGRIVGNATLHRKPFGGLRHLGKLRIVVDPEYRNQGLGSWLLLDLMNHAMHAGIEKLIAEVVADQEGRAVVTGLRRLGFVQEAILQDYARDPHGQPHDLLILSRGFYNEFSEF